MHVARAMNRENMRALVISGGCSSTTLEVDSHLRYTRHV